jgi:plastocyanin
MSHVKFQRVAFDADPGQYTVLCKAVGHEGMSATLVVG